MVSAPAGRTSPGCLLVLLLLVAGGYFGINVGEAYWRYYKLEDGMKSAAHFAGSLTDNQILTRLYALGDSIALPDAAFDNLVVARGRTTRTILIETAYTERVELPLFVRELRFAPRVEADF